MIETILESLKVEFERTLNEYLQAGEDPEAIRKQAEHLENAFFPVLHKQLGAVFQGSMDPLQVQSALEAIEPYLEADTFADKRDPLPDPPIADAEETTDEWTDENSAHQSRLEKLYALWIARVLDRIAGFDDRRKRNLLGQVTLSGHERRMIMTSLDELEREMRDEIASSAMEAVSLVFGDQSDPESVGLVMNEINAQSAIIASSLLPDIQRVIENFLKSPEGAGFELAPLKKALEGISARVGSYSGSHWRVLNQLEAKRLMETDQRVFWQMDSQAQSCPDCATHGETEYESVEAMLKQTGGLQPASANLTCAPNCRCRLIGAGPSGVVL